MEVRFTRGRHPSEIEKYFDPTSMDPFYNNEVLIALHGSSTGKTMASVIPRSRVASSDELLMRS
jgi:hypothetical protein